MHYKRWRRLIDCLKLQVIFRKRAIYYRALLRKMTCNLRHLMGLRHSVVECQTVQFPNEYNHKPDF